MAQACLMGRTDSKAGGAEGGINEEAGMNIYPLICINKSINEDLLCSTRNSTEHCNNLNRKTIQRRIDIGLCITESSCCTLKHKIINQLYSNRH